MDINNWTIIVYDDVHGDDDDHDDGYDYDDDDFPQLLPLQSWHLQPKMKTSDLFEM